MMQTPTIHNAASFGDIAKTVLLPGDPQRAKLIAETYLDHPVQYTDIRGMMGFTGTWKDTRISVQGTGMGGPSMGIYSYELIHAYGVENLIRIGSAGALQPGMQLGNLVLAVSASHDSGADLQDGLKGSLAATASFELLDSAWQTARRLGTTVSVGPVLSSDVFYDDAGLAKLNHWKDMGILAVEMEAASLYRTAMKGKARALCMLTISDLPFQGQAASAEERRSSFTAMMELALETARSLAISDSQANGIP